MSTSQSRAGLALRIIALLVSLSLLNPLVQAVPVHHTHPEHKVETAPHHESAPHLPVNFHPVEGLPGFPKLHETIPVFHAPVNLLTVKPGTQLRPNLMRLNSPALRIARRELPLEVIRIKPESHVTSFHEHRIKRFPAIARREFIDDADMY